MLDYHGPPEWKALVDEEEPRAGEALLEATRAAEDTLPRQGFEARRTRYLGKHLTFGNVCMCGARATSSRTGRPACSRRSWSGRS
jgi:hypothetical protein